MANVNFNLTLLDIAATKYFISRKQTKYCRKLSRLNNIT